MKKFTVSVVILALLLIQEIHQTQAFAQGGCMGTIPRGSGGVGSHRGSGGVGSHRPSGGHSVEVKVGQQKSDGRHWDVTYTNKPDEHNVNVKAGQKKPNGDYWGVDYNHDMRKN